jgi:multiple sugar transport system permease protein
MPIILKTEKRHVGTKVLYFLLYLLLAAGACSMVYPFLQMVSGSLKSRVDAQDLDVVPRFLHDGEMLYRKYEEAKYGEDLQSYVRTTDDKVRNFRAVTPPPECRPALVKDWREFVETSGMPASWFLTGFGPTLEGRIIQRNERAFRNFVRDLCDNDIETFRTRFDEPIENWFFLKFRPERLTDRKYQVSDTVLMETFYAFKKGLPAEDRIYVSCDDAFERYVKLSVMAVSDQSDTSGRSGGNERQWLSAAPQPGHWELFVRQVLHPQFIRVSDDARSVWGSFLTKKHGSVANLNKLYGADYGDLEDVPFPEDRLKASAQLTDFLLFLTDGDALPSSALSLDTPELRWRRFLRDRYSTIKSVSEVHGRDYADFDVIPMPQREADLDYCIGNAGEIRGDFAAANFKMVFEYILLYGHGIRNTIIYCALAIALSLLVNPLAAYALSRYNLPSQYKILLFLIATMAFPGVVTMIPNFLLLRDLGLLNTFAALLLPAMANGYAIFLLKGFFDSLPRELFEAADIDGANEWHKFWIITMNLSKPVLAVIALGAFTGAYSNFMYAFILCQDRNMWTLMVWLYQLQQFSSQGVVFASLLVAAIPTLLVFVLCQNIIIKGIVVPTEK